MSASMIVLYNSAHEILLQYRCKDSKKHPNYWGFFGGRMEAKETPLEAILRETKEELNYELKDPILFHEAFDIDNKNPHYFFIEAFDENKTLCLLEGEALGWYSVEQAQQLKMASHLQMQLGRVDEYLLNVNFGLA